MKNIDININLMRVFEQEMYNKIGPKCAKLP